MPIWKKPFRSGARASKVHPNRRFCQNRALNLNDFNGGADIPDCAGDISSGRARILRVKGP